MRRALGAVVFVLAVIVLLEGGTIRAQQPRVERAVALQPLAQQARRLETA